jgi:carboxyl-terminal processing protease
MYRSSLALLTAGLLLGSVFATGYSLGSGEKLSAGSLSPLFAGEHVEMPRDIDLDQFWKVWSVLENKAPQEKVWGAIKGLTDSYEDPYTVFLTPEEARLFQENISGTFSGVGMEIAIEEDGILTVVAPLKNSPAEKAGIRAGDKIIGIGDAITRGMTVDEAVLLIRGKAGTTVDVTIWREGESRAKQVTLTRANIALPTIDTEMLPGNIFYIRLYSFTENAPALFQQALAEYRANKGNGIILDLRNNPGGYLDGAVEITSHFIEEGKTVVTEDYGDNGEDKVHRSKGYGTVPSTHNVVVLVNEGSASASEIVAGALSEHNRAVLVGRETFGKGSVQELVPITKDTALKVTIARWLTPKRHSLSSGGIEPDIVIEEEATSTYDPDKERATQLIRASR